MLPPYIIEQIRKREEEDARQAPVVQLPVPEPSRKPQAPPKPAEDGERGVVIIDLA
jgi:hypothetical protein